MKAIIFTGIALFGAAAIYGITDFAAEKKRGRIDQLYKEETAAAPATAATEMAATPVAAGNTTAPAAIGTGNTAAAKKNTVKKKTRKAPKEAVRFIRVEDFSRGRIAPREIKAGTAPLAVEEIKEQY